MIVHGQETKIFTDNIQDRTLLVITLIQSIENGIGFNLFYDNVKNLSLVAYWLKNWTVDRKVHGSSPTFSLPDALSPGKKNE